MQGGQQRGPINGLDPLVYTGGLPNLVVMQREPTPTDFEGFFLGHWWIIPVEYSDTGTGEVWVLVSKRFGIATWKRLHGGGITPPTQNVVIGNQYFTTPGAGSYFPSSGMLQCYVECLGGGGGGFAGGNTGSYQETQGGGGGGYTAKLYTAAQIGLSQPFFVGNGGLGTNYNDAAPGNSGQDSTFSSGSLLITAQGGQSAVEVAHGFYNSFGGNGIGGDINIQGQCGWSSRFTATGIQRGGDSLLGFGGYMETTSSPSTIPFNGQLYGGGGCGAASSGASAGAQGIIKITEYFA